MDSGVCIVMTSIGTEDEAEALAAGIVEAHLAACVQIQRVRSLYIWQGVLHREPEWVLHIKTVEARYAAIEAFSRERRGAAPDRITCASRERRCRAARSRRPPRQ